MSHLSRILKLIRVNNIFLSNGNYFPVDGMVLFEVVCLIAGWNELDWCKLPK